MPPSATPSRSADVQDIIRGIPAWIVRWGITMVALTVAALFFAAWLIHYPDVITARVTIVALTPPVRLIARSGGTVRLHVSDNASVTSGTLLAVIDNPARPADVFALQAQLQRVGAALSDPLSLTNQHFDHALMLGELQPVYAEFLQTLTSYQLIAVHAGDTNLLPATTPRYGDHVSKLVHQRVILAKEFEVAEKKLASSQALYERGLLAEMELNEVEKLFHEKRATLEYVNADIEYVTRSLVLSLQLMYKRLESQLAEWEQKYVLRAPLDGQVSLFTYRSNNQYIQAGDEVLSVVPPANTLAGHVLLPIAGSGKVRAGQRVFLRCDSYPHREYGALRGMVASISLTPRNDEYLVRVELPDGLVTTFNKPLEYRQEMHGTALIVTRDVRLITRIFNEFRYLFSSATD